MTENDNPRSERALKAIADIIKREGGDRYTDNPADRGGPTKFGVTQEALSRWRGYDVAPHEVAILDQQEAEHIFAETYINKPGLEEIEDTDLFAYVADCSVHHGSWRAVKFLQAVAGVGADGVLGPITAKAVNEGDASDLLNKIRRHRVLFMARIVKRDPSQVKFLAGWLDRALAA
ncbi:MAG: glycoside hydrolase family 108 protein [Geminicoccaceae bacterium]